MLPREVIAIAIGEYFDMEGIGTSLTEPHWDGADAVMHALEKAGFIIVKIKEDAIPKSWYGPKK